MFKHFICTRPVRYILMPNLECATIQLQKEDRKSIGPSRCVVGRSQHADSARRPAERCGRMFMHSVNDCPLPRTAGPHSWPLTEWPQQRRTCGDEKGIQNKLAFGETSILFEMKLKHKTLLTVSKKCKRQMFFLVGDVCLWLSDIFCGIHTN